MGPAFGWLGKAAADSVCLVSLSRWGLRGARPCPMGGSVTKLLLNRKFDATKATGEREWEWPPLVGHLGF